MDRVIIALGRRGSRELFQLGHFFAEMDSYVATITDIVPMKGFNWATSSQKWIDPVILIERNPERAFQLGHFFAEMDRHSKNCQAGRAWRRFNWATSSQKWIDVVKATLLALISGFQLGHFFAEMDRRPVPPYEQFHEAVSIGPLLRRNG